MKTPDIEFVFAFVVNIALLASSCRWLMPKYYFQPVA